VTILVVLFVGSFAGAALALSEAISLHRGPHAVLLTRPPLAFDLPPGWHTRERLGKPTDDWVREAAAKEGFTPEEFIAESRASMLSSQVGPVTGGRYQTVDVQKGGFATLPTAGEVEQSLTARGFQVDRVREVPTPAGQVLLAQARIRLSDGEVQTRLVHMVSHGTGVVITVSAVGGGNVVPVTDGILATLRTP